MDFTQVAEYFLRPIPPGCPDFIAQSYRRFSWNQSIGGHSFGGSLVLRTFTQFPKPVLVLEMRDNEGCSRRVFTADHAVEEESVESMVAGIEELAAEAAACVSKLALCGVCKRLNQDTKSGTCTPCAFATSFYRTRTETTQVDADGVTTKKRTVFGSADSLDDCSICLEKMYPIANALYTTKCEHSFHRRCFCAHVEARRKQGRSGDCPLCRAPSEESDYPDYEGDEDDEGDE